MKKLLLRLIVAMCASFIILQNGYAQVPDSSAITEFQRIISSNNDINTTINWSRIGQKIFKHFVKRFHLDPNGAKWTMIKERLYATFLYNNRQTIAVYNKHGRFVKLRKAN